MIRAHLKDTGVGSSRTFELHTEGHGQTDVCIATSVLAQSVAAYLEKLEGDHPGGLVVTTRIGDGTLDVVAQTTDYWNVGLHSRLNAMQELLILALSQLNTQSPSEIHFLAGL